MAEYQEVMRHYNRMSEEERINLYESYKKATKKDDGIVACNCTIAKGHLPCVARHNADCFEKLVMIWAEAHPEPRYPTWKEWQEENFPDAEDDICPKIFTTSYEAQCLHYAECADCINRPIPEHIAKKLKIQAIVAKHKQSPWDAVRRDLVDDLKNKKEITFTYMPGGEIHE